LKTRTPLVREVRVKGVMIGIQLASDGTAIVQECLKRRLLINCTHQTVIRLLPAMNLSDADADKGMAILEEVLLAQQ
jgi:acetylornithine/succinyldiaminopimelate/putrescine aminotransferase